MIFYPFHLSFYHHFTIILPSFHHHFTIILPSFYHHFTIILPSFYHHFTIISPSFYHHFTIISPSFYHHFTIILPSFYRIISGSNSFVLGKIPRLAQLGGFVTCISRLDAGTSGALPVAMGTETAPAARWFQAQFAGRLAKKEYLCLCHGLPASWLKIFFDAFW